MKTKVGKKESSPQSTNAFVMQVGEQLFSRLDDHIRMLKLFFKNDSQNKNEWVMEAINEKLEREQTVDIRIIPKDRFLSVKLAQPVHQKLEQRINFIRKFRSGFSKKQWVVDAIIEKLEVEEKKSRELLDKLQAQSDATPKKR